MIFSRGFRLWAAAAGALVFLGCSGESGGSSDGDCTVETGEDGSVTLKCGDESTMIVPGADGQDGANGQDGSSGQDGADGTPGADGADGAGGTPGADGADGDAGPPGRPGTDGQDGSDGADGGPGQDADECTVVDNGDGTSTQTCPDGTSTTWWTGFSGRIFYRADADNDAYEQLYMTHVKGGAPTSFIVNQEPQEYGEVHGYLVSDDGDTVVFYGDLETDGISEIYYADLIGDAPATPVKVNGTLVSGGEVDGVFNLSANGETLVYVADQETDEKNELYYVDLSGASPAAPVKISGTLPVDHIVWYKSQPQVSEDGNRVIYLAGDSTSDTYELYLVDLSGVTPTTPVKISGALASGGRVADTVVFSADGRTAVYRADQDTDEVFEIYSVDLSGASPATPVKLNTSLPTNADIDIIAISRDGDTVIYRGDQDVYNDAELYYVDLSGASPAAPVQFNSALPTGGDVSGFTLSRDGNAVIFRADMDVNDVVELFLVDLSGVSPTAPVQVNGELVTNGNLASNERVSADGQAVLYRADQETDDIFELYHVDVSGEEPGLSVKVNTALPTNADVDYFYLSQDGDTIVYAGDQEIYNFRELYLVSMMPNGQPTTPLKLNVPMISGGDVQTAIEIRPL